MKAVELGHCQKQLSLAIAVLSAPVNPHTASLLSRSPAAIGAVLLTLRLDLDDDLIDLLCDVYPPRRQRSPTSWCPPAVTVGALEQPAALPSEAIPLVDVD